MPVQIHDSDFQRLFVFSEVRWEVITHFVNIGRIVDYHCLDVLLVLLILVELLTITVKMFSSFC